MIKKMLTVAVVVLATFTATGCYTTPEESSEERIDRLYKECIDAGGSFSTEYGWARNYACTLPNTNVPSGNVDVEVNQ